MGNCLDAVGLNFFAAQEFGRVLLVAVHGLDRSTLAGEKRGHPPKVFLLPGREGMVVAFGATDADTQKHSAKGVRQVVGRVSHGSREGQLSIQVSSFHLSIGKILKKFVTNF